MNAIVQPGRCRVCGCTELTPCKIDLGDEIVPCAWYSDDATLCNNPRCVGSIPLEELERMKTTLMMKRN